MSTKKIRIINPRLSVTVLSQNYQRIRIKTKTEVKTLCFIMKYQMVPLPSHFVTWMFHISFKQVKQKTMPGF